MPAVLARFHIIMLVELDVLGRGRVFKSFELLGSSRVTIYLKKNTWKEIMDATRWRHLQLQAKDIMQCAKDGVEVWDRDGASLSEALLTRAGD